MVFSLCKEMEVGFLTFASSCKITFIFGEELEPFATAETQP